MHGSSQPLVSDTPSPSPASLQVRADWTPFRPETARPNWKVCSAAHAAVSPVEAMVWDDGCMQERNYNVLVVYPTLLGHVRLLRSDMNGPHLPAAPVVRHRCAEPSQIRQIRHLSEPTVIAPGSKACAGRGGTCDPHVLHSRTRVHASLNHTITQR